MRTVHYTTDRMQFGQLFANAQRWGAVTAPKISRFGHGAAAVLSKAGDIGHMLAVRGGAVVNYLDQKTPLGQNPELAALFGGARALLRDVDIGSGFASRAAVQGNKALNAYDKTVLPAAQRYLSSDFEKAPRGGGGRQT